jgi:hypothetical protein
MNMPNWRKGLVIGSFAAGALLIIKGHRPAGIAAATVGLAILASEYPEKFEDIWEQAPDYIYKGTQIFATLSRVAERFAENASERGLSDAFQDIREQYAR